MKTIEIIEAIKALTEVVKANNTLFGSESTKVAANEKILVLQELLMKQKENNQQ